MYSSLGYVYPGLAKETIRDSKSRKSILVKIFERMRYEIKPCISHNKLILKLKEENILFLSISWLTSITAMSHLLLGTIVFSSSTFIGKFLR